MLVKHNNNSISSITTPGSLAQGKMTLISSQTASGSASISFTSGIDSTYPIYRFEFINLHPASQSDLRFNFSTDGGSNYNVTKTTTLFNAYHNESDTSTNLSYQTAYDLAQGTGDATLSNLLGNNNDESLSGYFLLFNPSSTTFVKHFISCNSTHQANSYMNNNYIAGYGNTTSSINSIIFRMLSGNIDSGTIKLYGIKDS